MAARRTIGWRIRTAAAILLGRPVTVAYEWGGGNGLPALPGSIPALTVPATEPDLILSIGIEGFRFDGKPFPFATVGDWRLTFSDDALTTLSVDIAVRIDGAVPV